MKLRITLAGLVISLLVFGGVAGPSASNVIAQQAQPIPSANDDVRIVAGLLLAQELDNIASKEAVIPAGMLKLATNPAVSGWDKLGTGATAMARAAGANLAPGEVLLAPAAAEFQATPNLKIKNPLLQRAGTAQNNMLLTVYKAVVEAEAAGQMELAYALASTYLTNGLLNFFNRGVVTGFQRIDDCLSGKDTSLEITDPSTGKATDFPVECSKSKVLQPVVATQIAAGALSFLGPLADITCSTLLQKATQSASPGERLAAARAYVQGVQVYPGVFDSCIKPSEEQSSVDALLASAQQAQANNYQELLEEVVGYDYQTYADGQTGIYSSTAARRGLAKALQEADTSFLEALAQDANNPQIGLAAYYELGNRWADSKQEAELRAFMTDGPTPAVRRAATKALLTRLGRAFDVQCLQNLANGQECK